jgi:outer membrane protein assembly factor BamD
MTRNFGIGTRALPRLLLAACLLGSLGACSSSSSDEGDTGFDTASLPPQTLYAHGVDALGKRNYTVAGQQFDLVETNYPTSSWAVTAQLMEGYAQYLQGHYPDAISTLERFIQLHPANRDIAYAYYLRALCFYEQIEDIQRDQKITLQAITALQEVVNRFPGSAYARDAALKIDLGRDHLAGHEMLIGRFYQDQHLYAAAIGRFQAVVDDFQTTNHVAEALARLTEVYLALGLTEEAKRTAAVLGHNYPGSTWYEDSYNQLVADHVITAGPGQLPPPSSRGFFSRAWHAVF